MLVFPFAAMVFAMVIGGCARFPEGGVIVPPREMTFHIEFRGPVNDSYYYFVAFDTDGGGDGPLPVFPGASPGGVTADAWVTGSATHFVQYSGGQYTVYRITSLQPYAAERIGAPLRSSRPIPGGKVLDFTLDLNLIEATGDSIDINIIAVDYPRDQMRMLDALGEQGTQFLREFDIMTDRPAVTNTEFGIRLEPELDVLDQNWVPAYPQPTAQTDALDIADWSIAVDI